MDGCFTWFRVLIGSTNVHINSVGIVVRRTDLG
jgi:hypothetical protein